MSPQKNIRGFCISLNPQNWFRHLRSAPPSFYGVRKCELWPRFSSPAAREVLWFRNEATGRKFKASVGSAGNWPKYNSDVSPVIFLNFAEAQKVRNLAIEALYMCVLVSRCVANIYSFREFREFVIFVQL